MRYSLNSDGHSLCLTQEVLAQNVPMNRMPSGVRRREKGVRRREKVVRRREKVVWRREQKGCGEENKRGAEKRDYTLGPPYIGSLKAPRMYGA